MVPLKLDDLLGSPELMEHFGGSGKLEQTTSSPSSSGNDELDVEALKLVVGAMIPELFMGQKVNNSKIDLS
jgi:hypothetical protein